MTSASSTTTPTVPGYLAGTWDIDPAHSDVSFSIRHMMVSKVRGRFGKFSGQIITAEQPLQSSATATIDMSSVDTNNPDRDAHVRGTDFFDVETHPEMTFRSTGITPTTDGFVLEGELTLHGVTREVPLGVEVNGFGPDAWGGTRAGFTATGEISRKDFGIEFSMPLEAGGVGLGDKVQIAMEIEAVLQQPAG